MGLLRHDRTCLAGVRTARLRMHESVKHNP